MMTRPANILPSVLILALLGGCSGLAQSRLNPLNWFGPRPATQVAFSIEKPADPRPLIEQIVTAKVEPLPTGALVRATGLAATQGYWQADLVVGGLDEAGTLTIDFRAIPAPAGAAVSTPRSRQITAAVSLRGDTFASAKRIVVRGAQNQMRAK